MLRQHVFFLAEVLLALSLLSTLYVSALALAGRAFGVSIRHISYGIGPTLFRSGKFAVRLFLFMGYVKFKDTRVEDPEAAAEDLATDDAFNYQPRLTRVAIALAGPASAIAIALLLRPEGGLAQVLQGFGQIVSGSLRPLSLAQSYLSGTQAVAVSAGFLTLTGLLAAKLAAFNLIPLPMLNGGQALLALVVKPGTAVPAWEQPLMKWTLWLMILVMLSWLAAVVVYLL